MVFDDAQFDLCKRRISLTFLFYDHGKASAYFILSEHYGTGGEITIQEVTELRLGTQADFKL